MNSRNRIERLERVTGMDEDPPVVVVDRGEGPIDPAERAAWVRSGIPDGAKNVVVIKVVREETPRHGASLDEDTSYDE